MLSLAAQHVIANYLNLPFPNLTGVSCPYFLNKGNKVRGGLRVIIGKGSPEDIVEETSIIARRDRLDLSGMTAEQMKKFLVDNRLGVDCSALACYILDAECQARSKGKLKNLLKYPQIKNPLRKLLIKLRPVENTGVKVLADDANSVPVALESIQLGDMIIMLGSGQQHDYDHVLIVHDVDRPATQATATTPSPSLERRGGEKSPLEGGTCPPKLAEGERRWRGVLSPPAGGGVASSDPPTGGESRGGGGGSDAPFIIHYTHSLRWLSDSHHNHGVRQGQIIITHPDAPLTEQRWVEQGKEGRENETLQERAKKAKTLEIRRLKQLDELPAA